eukprot:scpid78074/ scgid22599/ 
MDTAPAPTTSVEVPQPDDMKPLESSTSPGKPISPELVKDHLAIIGDLKERVERILLENPDAVVSIPQLLQQRGSDVRKLNILLVGPSGAGKSTLANTLLLEEFSQVKHAISPMPVTEKLAFETTRVTTGNRDWELRIWDCPGFVGANDKDEKVLSDIKSMISVSGEPDLVILCFDMAAYGGRRFTNVHDHYVKKLKEVNGGKLFKRCAIAMTKINLLAQMYERDAEEEKQRQRAESAKMRQERGKRMQKATANETDEDAFPEWHGKFLMDLAQWKKIWRDILLDAEIPMPVVDTIPFCMFGEMIFDHNTKKPVDVTPIGPWQKQWLRDNWTMLVNACADELIQLFFFVCHKFQVNEAISREVRHYGPNGTYLKFEKEELRRTAVLATVGVLGMGTAVGAALAPFTFGLSALTMAFVLVGAAGTAGTGAGLFQVWMDHRQKERDFQVEWCKKEKNRKEEANHVFLEKPASEVLENLKSLEDEFTVKPV